MLYYYSNACEISIKKKHWTKEKDELKCWLIFLRAADKREQDMIRPESEWKPEILRHFDCSLMRVFACRYANGFLR